MDACQAEERNFCLPYWPYRRAWAIQLHVLSHLATTAFALCQQSERTWQTPPDFHAPLSPTAYARLGHLVPREPPLPRAPTCQQGREAGLGPLALPSMS